MFFTNPNGAKIPQAYPAGSATGWSGTRMRADRMTVRASQGVRPPTRRLFSSLSNLRVRDLPFPGGPAGERSARRNADASAGLQHDQRKEHPMTSKAEFRRDRYCGGDDFAWPA
jgi:hypothetical protein